MGVRGDFLTLIKSFSFERQQRLVLNRQVFERLTINWLSKIIIITTIIIIIIIIIKKIKIIIIKKKQLE